MGSVLIHTDAGRHAARPFVNRLSALISAGRTHIAPESWSHPRYLRALVGPDIILQQAIIKTVSQ